MPDPDWLVNASLAGARHEPETIARAIRQPACKNHTWANTDHCCRCTHCGLPLSENDPTD